eukprot:3176364-Pyramimonas_sp.AAC.1
MAFFPGLSTIALRAAKNCNSGTVHPGLGKRRAMPTKTWRTRTQEVAQPKWLLINTTISNYVTQYNVMP